jgi:colicin import membrane protein
MKRLLYLVAVALVALLAAPAVAQQQEEGQSLGDVAKKTKKSGKVITEDDLSKPADSEEKSDKDKEKDGEEKKDEAAPAADPADTRTEAQKAEDEVKKWTKEEADLQRKLSRLADKEQNEQSEFRKQMYRDAQNNQQITLGELRQKKEDAAKKLAEAQAKEKENEDKNQPK